MNKRINGDKLNTRLIALSVLSILIGTSLISILDGKLTTTQLVSAQSDDVYEYRRVAYCGFCHQDQVSAWNVSAHAKAYDDPTFQLLWQSQGKPEACLDCHTTRLNMSEGDFRFKGVACELCHGPGTTMGANVTEELCSSCHSYSHYPTYNEWLESEHNHQDVGCLDCHDLPSLKLKAENSTALCSSCHEEVSIEWKEGKHGSLDQNCTSCHMKKIPMNVGDGRAAVTGHAFYPSVPDPNCTSCHMEIPQIHELWGAGPEGCISCHDETYMTRMHLANGTSIAISESSVLCGQCHKDLYYKWKVGVHGSAHEPKNCTDCHSPWDPYVCSNVTLPSVPLSAPSKAPQVIASVVAEPSLPFYALIATMLVVTVGGALIARRLYFG